MDLAEKLWNFGVDFDPYETMDSTEVNDLESFKRNLWKPDFRKGIKAFLRDVIAYGNDDTEAEMAAELLREMS